MIVTITDVRRLFCAKGARRFAEQNGIDFVDFIKNGMPASSLYGRGFDGLIDRIVAAKLEAEALHERG